jgi:hypothetical protein
MRLPPPIQIFLPVRDVRGYRFYLHAIKQMAIIQVSEGAFKMRHFLTLAVLNGIAVAQIASIDPKVAPDPGDPPVSKLEVSATPLPDVPPTPQGKSTVIGGAIREVDAVRDQVTLNVFGGKTLKILFDERTQVYRDGKRAQLRDLRAGEHVSVETMLDGTTVFARSVHMLSQSPQGECQGQVVRYDRGSGELLVRDLLTPDPIRLRVSSGTPIFREGQESSSGDLTAGMLIAAQFQADGSGQNVARKISVLATPGRAFVFTGNVVFLDLRSGRLVLVDPRDGKRYEISFDPATSIVSRDVREGTGVSVTASFDGTRYTAQSVAVNQAPGR